MSDEPAGQLIRRAGAAFMSHEPAAVVAPARQSGAVCLIAHPGRTDGYLTFTSQLQDDCRHETAVDGLELYYPRHTLAQTQAYQAYAQRHQLLVSAGYLLDLDGHVLALAEPSQPGLDSAGFSDAKLIWSGS